MTMCHLRKEENTQQPTVIQGPDIKLKSLFDSCPVRLLQVFGAQIMSYHIIQIRPKSMHVDAIGPMA